MLQPERTYGKRTTEKNVSFPRFFRTQAKEAVLELLWPTRCAICDKPGDLVCDTCRQALKFYDPWLACATCGAPYGHVPCCECNSYTRAKKGQLGQVPFFCASAVLFNEESGSIIRCYKDSGEQRLSEFIAQLMQNSLADETWKRFEAITFIPSSPKSYARRGFDHMEMIAQTIARAQHIPLLHAFERPDSNDQRELTQRQRLQNLSNAFQLRGRYRSLALPRRVLVVDDVMTTGATFHAAASALEKAGVRKIEGLTFARVV